MREPLVHVQSQRANSIEARVYVHMLAAGEPAQRHATVHRELDRERRRGPHSDEDRCAGDGGLLHQLERQPAADAHDPSVQREPFGQQTPPDHLVHRVVATNVLARADQRTVGVEQAGRVQSAGSREARLHETVGQRREQAPGHARPGGQRRTMDSDLLESALAADTHEDVV
jgi:hypothetical protein